MDTNNLKKLSRKDLLELLLEQMKENQELKQQLEVAQNELKRREIIVSKKGTLAEAALEIVEIFEKADEAAQIYLENVKHNEFNDDN
ncbi:MAG: DNA repair protein [Clostridiaceae bacterium]|nr:DNA repair protein [Clostridiaceae bacterium]